MKIDYIMPYSLESESGLRLAVALCVPILDKNSTVPKGGPGKVVLNWGYAGPSSAIANGTTVLNKWDKIANVVDKIRTFAKIGEPFCVPFTLSGAKAKEWIREGHTVVCRKTTQGRDGQGIVMANKIEELVTASLYTKFIVPKEVYRIHVMRTTPGNYKVISWARMARKYNDDGTLPPHKPVRSYSNGYVFSTNGRAPTAPCYEMSTKIVSLLQLDFAALDILYDGTKYYFLEANSAPGIEKRNVPEYIDGFKLME